LTFNLIASAESKDLKIQEDQEKRIYIKGLKEFPVGNEEAVFELIDRGNATRMTAANGT
jgi:hypothetical protein